jgi:hypothetical protein
MKMTREEITDIFQRLSRGMAPQSIDKIIDLLATLSDSLPDETKQDKDDAKPKKDTLSLKK